MIWHGYVHATSSVAGYPGLSTAEADYQINVNGRRLIAGQRDGVWDVLLGEDDPYISIRRFGDDLEFDLRIDPATFATDVFVEAQLQGMAVARARDIGTGCLPGYADVDAAHTATLRLTLPPARRSRRRAGSS